MLYIMYHFQIDNDPDGNVPARRRQYGAQIVRRERDGYDGEGMDIEENEDENERAGGEAARTRFIERSFGDQMVA